ncbi:MAG: KilA-N domain-containing protein [Spirochaetes bacterium]|nr:KilA-N domain-containing protein [Spirochaetota bacterium]
MAKETKDKIIVKGIEVRYSRINQNDYMSLTDIAQYKNPNAPKDVVKNWLRSKETIAFLGLWESLNNPDFKGVEFDSFRNEAGYNAFTLSPEQWIEKTGAIGITTSRGRYSQGTFAHKDIAFEFATWVSVEFKLYFIYEYQRLKEAEQKLLGWSAKRELAKINYHIHTDAVKQNLVPKELTPKQAAIIYADEADVLNVALFGMTAKEWRTKNPKQKGNIRDYAEINELICLSNMENINAVLIHDGIPQHERLLRLNKIAIQQMTILAEVQGRKLLK